MLLFLIGLIVGVIFGIALIAILTSGAIADQWMEYTLKEKCFKVKGDGERVIIPLGVKDIG